MKQWTTVLLVLAAGLISGCCCFRNDPCTGDYVPVSLEGAYDFVHHYGRCYYRFPYSCPPCPYFSGVTGGYQVHSEYDVPTAAYDAPAPAEEMLAPALPESSAPKYSLPPIPKPQGE